MKTLVHSILVATAITGTLAVHAADIIVDFVQGPADHTLQVPVSAAQSTGIVAAAFSVDYDTNALDVSVESTFFDTFANQYIQSGAFEPRATSVVIDGRTNLQPLVVAAQSNGLAIAGVRRVPSDKNSETLFTLDVALRPGSPGGLYQIHLQPTAVRLTAAGYPAAGEPLNLLIGRDALNDSYPIVLGASEASMHLVPGYVRFTRTDPDTDGDGLPDAWEMQYLLQSHHRQWRQRQRRRWRARHH